MRAHSVRPLPAMRAMYMICGFTACWIIALRPGRCFGPGRAHQRSPYFPPMAGAEPEQSPIERRIERAFEDDQGVGKPLSRRARQTRRSVEAYLRAGVLPRYMERLREIERETEEQKARLARAYRLLEEECAGDADLFASLWRRRAEAS